MPRAASVFDLGAAENYKKVKAVKEAMYEVGVVTRACYKLLNASGAVGCQGEPGACMDDLLVRRLIPSGLPVGQVVVASTARSPSPQKLFVCLVFLLAGKDSERIRAPVVHYKDLSRFLDGECALCVL